MTLEKKIPAAGLLHLNPNDNVVIVTGAVTSGQQLKAANITLTAPRDLELGHKLALLDIEKGAAVVKYGCKIGVAACRISAGDHVHLHNLVSSYTIIEDIEGTNT